VLDRAVALAPESSRALDYRGVCVVRLGRAEEALAVFDRALERAPGEGSVIKHKGVRCAGSSGGTTRPACSGSRSRTTPYGFLEGFFAFATVLPRNIRLEQPDGVVQHARRQVHVAQRGRERGMARELLDRLGRRATHGEAGAERMAQRVPSDPAQPGTLAQPG
jgi:hypothetical protein